MNRRERRERRARRNAGLLFFEFVYGYFLARELGKGSMVVEPTTVQKFLGVPGVLGGKIDRLAGLQSPAANRRVVANDQGS